MKGKGKEREWGYLAKRDMMTIEVGRGNSGDEELTSIR